MLFKILCTHSWDLVLELPGNVEISTAGQCKLIDVYLVNALCPLSTLISSRENRILGLGTRLWSSGPTGLRTQRKHRKNQNATLSGHFQPLSESFPRWLNTRIQFSETLSTFTPRKRQGYERLGEKQWRKVGFFLKARLLAYTIGSLAAVLGSSLNSAFTGSGVGSFQQRFLVFAVIFPP
jgi:hypothetical protein